MADETYDKTVTAVEMSQDEVDALSQQGSVEVTGETGRVQFLVVNTDVDVEEEDVDPEPEPEVVEEEESEEDEEESDEE